jgi:hypothetical protein
MIQAPSARSKARTFTFGVAFVTTVGVVAACSLSPRANGDSCLKDTDCLSGVCAAAVCVAAPTLLDAEVNGDGSLLDATSGGDSATSSDTGTVKEAAAEAAAETGVGGDGAAAETGATDSGSSDSAVE